MTGQPRRNMTTAQLLDVTEVERLVLRPGDILVFKVPHRLSDAEYEEISNRLGFAFPDVKRVILEQGCDISVLRAEGAEPTP